MIINNLDIRWPPFSPEKANSILNINTDAMLTERSPFNASNRLPEVLANHQVLQQNPLAPISETQYSKDAVGKFGVLLLNSCHQKCLQCQHL